MKAKELGEVKSQLWDHLDYLIERIHELNQEGHTVRTRDWLGDQYYFCKTEIEYWKSLS